MQKKVFVWMIVFLLLVSFGCATMKDKSRVQTYIQNGQKYESQGNLVQALKQFKLALAVDPRDKEAIERSNRLEKKMHVLAEENYRQGLKLRNKGKYELARRKFSKTLELQPDHSGALRAIKFRKQVHWKKFIVHTIKPGESLSTVADIYYGDYKKFPIIAEFNNMSDATKVTVGQKIKVPEITGPLSLADKHDVEVGEVKIFDSIDRGQKIRQEQVEMIEKDEGRKENAEQLEYQVAIAKFNKALNVNPDDKIALANLSSTYFRHGIMLFKKKDYLEAGKNFEAAYRYNNDCQKCQDYVKKSRETYEKTHYNRGLSYFGKQQLPEAIREWELVCAVDSNYKEVEENLKKARSLLERLEQIKKGLHESQTE
jgi:tetratricopeptide (TPR) repeat protein